MHQASNNKNGIFLKMFHFILNCCKQFVFFLTLARPTLDYTSFLSLISLPGKSNIILLCLWSALEQQGAPLIPLSSPNKKQKWFKWKGHTSVPRRRIMISSWRLWEWDSSWGRPPPPPPLPWPSQKQVCLKQFIWSDQIFQETYITPCTDIPGSFWT